MKWEILIVYRAAVLYEVSGIDSIRGAVKKFPELWYSTVMVGYMTTLT